jgi:hypothetical protein
MNVIIILIVQDERSTYSPDCKVLLNKDHATCGKERFIRIQTAGLPYCPQIREQQLG